MLPADHEGRPDEARALALQALALAARSGSANASGAAALAHGELAWLALQQLDFARVEHHLALGIDEARRCAELPARAGGYDGYELQLRVIQITALQQQERHAKCLRAVDGALEALARRRRPYLHDRFHFLLLRGNSELQLGNVEAAALSAGELLALAQAMQMPRLEATALQQQAALALRDDDLDTAAALATRAEAIARGVVNENALPQSWRQLGEVAARRGDVPAALTHWQRALDLLQRQERAAEALQLRACAPHTCHGTRRGPKWRPCWPRPPPTRARIGAP
jgi:tetratricopeptide (TPR) repeat protein